MRALVRGAAARSWRSRSAAADACSPICGELDSVVASSGSACTSSSSCPSSAWLQLLKTARYSSWSGPASHSVSDLLHSFSLSPSYSSFGCGALPIPSPVSSFLVPAPSTAPLSVLSAGLHRSLADLRPGKLCGGAQQLGGGSSALSAMVSRGILLLWA